MTLPDERYRAIKYTEQFLKELCDPNTIPRIPKMIRMRASSLLRHYPSEFDLQRMAEASPDVIAEKMEPLTRLCMQYELDKKHPDNV